MSVKVAVENDHNLVLTYFHGRVSVESAFAAMDDLAAAVAGLGAYRGLVIFDYEVDLSAWDGGALLKIRSHAAPAYRRLRLRRGESAAVVNFVPEAEFVMGLWNALCDSNGDTEMAFNVFWDVRPALRFLDLPPEVRQRVMRLATPTLV